jgi:L,D-transpeptidase catalytic domain
MRYLAATLLALISAQAWANELDSLLQQARVLGAPMAAVQRAIQISRQPIFPKKDVLAVFDISQPSAKKRFYVLDFKSGQVTAHYAAHGRDNGPSARAIKFKGFQTDLDMVPLGPLKTAHSEVLDPYKTIIDRYDKTVYPDMIVVALEGVAFLQQLHQPHAPVQMVHPPELVHNRWFSRQKSRHAGEEQWLRRRRSGRKQPARHAASGWSSGLRDGRKCPDRTIFVTRAFALKVKLSWKCAAFTGHWSVWPRSDWMQPSSIVIGLLQSG